MAHPPPIRLGIIGLSSSAATSWASTAHLPYLFSPRGRTKYTVVALCNSSVAAARAAIQTYRLDAASTRAYGSPRDLAADPDVDMVVCCTRVDTHFALTMPSVEAGKVVYVEWPLTHDVARSRALAAAAGAGGRSMAGFQGQLAPVVQRIREFLREGRLGKVLSSEVKASLGTMDRAAIKEALSYFGDMSVGGNVYMITFAHMFDYVQSALGEVTDLESRFQLQRPEMKLLDKYGNETGAVKSDVPDLVIVHGTLSDTSLVQTGATLSARFRRGQPFKGEPGFTWHINCEKGEIRLVSQTGSSLQADVYSVEPVSLQVHSHETDQVWDLDWAWPTWQDENKIPLAGRNVARLYEAYYAHTVEGRPREYPDFADALRRHEQLHAMLAGWKHA